MAFQAGTAAMRGTSLGAFFQITTMIISVPSVVLVTATFFLARSYLLDQRESSLTRQAFADANVLNSRLATGLSGGAAGAVDGTEEAVYRFTINPLVWWLWFGGFVLVFGGVITMWPGGGAQMAAPRRGEPAYVGSAGVDAGVEGHRLLLRSCLR